MLNMKKIGLFLGLVLSANVSASTCSGYIDRIDGYGGSVTTSEVYRVSLSQYNNTYEVSAEDAAILTTAAAGKFVSLIVVEREGFNQNQYQLW